MRVAGGSGSVAERIASAYGKGAYVGAERSDAVQCATGGSGV